MNESLPAYRIARKRVKYMRINVKAPHGEVVVSAPTFVSERAVRDFVASKAAWIAKTQERIGRMPAPLQAGPEAERLRRELRATVPGLLEYWADFMGLEVPEFTLRRMTTRWGTCNTQTRRIALSLELGRRDMELLEYVIVHELCHLLERSHNARFYAIMDRTLPDWKDKRKLLNGRV
ncbi:MAG: M48 family peptidase [Actinobacteria bacterium HGW-Actinobacteria-4]|nr:MAG: M48 family peptidase [Actinobacteria bacterium HGW-Actinobacteria-4]